MIRQTETAEFWAFDRNRELNHRLTRRCADIDRQLRNNLVHLRAYAADAFNFIEGVRRSTGYFLPAWWQEEKTQSVDEWEAKRRAALPEPPKPPKPRLKQRKPKATKVTKLKPIIKKQLNVISEPPIANDTQTHVSSPRNSKHVTLMPPQEKTDSPPVEPVPEDVPVSTAGPDEANAVAIIPKPASFTTKSFASLAEQAVKAPVKTAFLDDESLKVDIKPKESIENRSKGEEHIEALASPQLFERIRTMSVVKFNRILEEVDATDITRWLPDYDSEYRNTTRLGPSLKQHSTSTAEHQHAEEMPDSSKELDAQDWSDIRELRAILGHRGLKGSNARLFLTRMFSRRHCKAMQRPNFGIRHDTDGAVVLERELGPKIGAFRKRYQTLPEILITITEEGNRTPEQLAPPPRPPRRRGDPPRPPPPPPPPRTPFQNVESKLRNLRERTKLPYLQTDSTSSSLLLPIKHRTKLRDLQKQTLPDIKKH